MTHVTGATARLWGGSGTTLVALLEDSETTLTFSTAV
eukprot:SAG31_NODE_603_length_13622_cov_19.019953_13_plen_37_part_00